MKSHAGTVLQRAGKEAMMVAIASLLLCFAVGCEQVGKVVDDVKSEVAGTPTDSSAVPNPPVAAPAAPVMEPAKTKSPEEIVARFTKMASGDITDGDINELATSPQAAAAITQIDLTGNRLVSRAGLSQLTSLGNLVSLKMVSFEMGPSDLAVLGEIKSVKELLLSATRTDDSVIAALSAIPHLTKLDLSSTPVTSQAAGSLSKISELSDLNLSGTGSNDQTAALITALPLRRLDFSKTQITGLGVQELLRIESLEALNVSFTSVPGAAWKGSKSSNIKELSVSSTPFGIEGFDAIKGMKSLEYLNVYASGLVEHKAANIFRTLPNLRILNAGNNAVTDAGMEVFFKGLKKIEELHLGHNAAISDRGLAALVGTKSLRYLDVTGTNCTPNGAAALKQKLPDCKIATDNGTL